MAAGLRLKPLPRIALRDPNLVEIVSLNVGGETFMTSIAIFEKFPDTKLGRIFGKDERSIDNEDLFFDRDPDFFPYVLDMYRTGEMHVPLVYCVPKIQKELEFWEIPESQLSTCCWKLFWIFQEKQAVLDTIRKAVYSPQYLVSDTGKKRKWKNAIYTIMEDPYNKKYPKASKIVNLLHVSLLVVSQLVIMIQTMPEVRLDHNEQTWSTCSNITTNAKLLMYCNTAPHISFVYLDLIFSLLFSIEVIVKFIAWPKTIVFFKSFYNWMDIISILALWFVIIAQKMNEEWVTSHIRVVVGVMEVAILCRTCRMMKISRSNRDMRLLICTFRSTLYDIALLIIMIALGVLLFGTLVFTFENSADTYFMSISEGQWWALVTMTTVGYGDLYPQTFGGYVVGTFAVIAGVLTTGLAIPILNNHFVNFKKAARRVFLLMEKENQNGEGANDDLVDMEDTHVPPAAEVEANSDDSVSCNTRPTEEVNSSARKESTYTSTEAIIHRVLPVVENTPEPLKKESLRTLLSKTRPNVAIQPLVR